METQILDNVFGEMKFDDGWITETSIEFLGLTKQIEIWVAGNGLDRSIWQEQRDAYSYYQANETAILLEFSQAMFRHYLGIWPDLQEQFGASAAEFAPKIESIDELSKVIDVEALVFPIVCGRGERRFGFIGDCSWDADHGFGIEMGYSIGSSDKLI
ncbi:DUF6985 domain-containing protein [Roseibacillus persicicus]|uniref:DUF6985 domain-containing protein n=1 Tax=Roseibacillus persicicus TaxID=454148 RepID=UPI00280D53C4|nr:hypothetical protein [Roseibacillus persicicus]MDQ8192684.1 hypothetical protein [Roseibacillus persicicus]